MTEREQQASNMLQNIARDIQNKLPEGFGFTLLAYEFGDGDNRRMLYVSNGDRPNVLKAMEEFIEVNKGGNYGKDVE